MTFLDICEKYFETRSLYEVLGVPKTATNDELRRAYHKVSLKVHPDRVPAKEKKSATEQFQTLGKVYSVLSDEEKRKMYDDSGEIDDENLDPDSTDWTAFWRLHFKKVTIEDIKKFDMKYKNSEEELDDIKAAYEKGKGDMTVLLENVLCANINDEERFRKIVTELIEEGELPSYKKFTNESNLKREKRKKRAAAEAKEAEEYSKKIGLDNTEDSLQQLILKRGKERESQADAFLEGLAAKYGGGKSKKKSKQRN